MSELLESRWQETKEALLEGLQGTKKSVMATTLENTRRYLSESATAGATSAGNVATLNRVILPVIRRVMPTVIANELVGVQPMTGPVGQIHTLRVRYSDTFNAGASGATAGEEALSPFKIAESYSGATSGKAASTAALEGAAGNKLSIQILKQTVEAKTRKLSARWTFEAAQDAQAQQGIDIEAEIMAALAQEITAEIDQEVLASLKSLAGTQNQGVYNQATVSGTATFVGDEHAALAVQINRVANTIAQRTRRGAGNWAVVSPTVLTILQSATTSAFARTTEGTFEAPTNTKFVGTLNGAMKIYVNTYTSDDTVVIGYKGSSESDAAAFYCPYIPLMSSGVVLDPATFEPVVSFMTRYGYVELTNTASSLGNAADYLGTVTVSNTVFS
jgi:Major capsid protein Gp23